MAIWVVPSDVIDSWIGPNQPEDENVIGLWLDKAERLVLRRIPDLQARVALDPDLMYDVRDVVVAMVTRVFRNPEGIRQIQETAGSVSEGRTYGGDIPGGLDLTDAELARLGGVSDRSAFTVDTVPVMEPHPYYWML